MQTPEANKPSEAPADAAGKRSRGVSPADCGTELEIVGGEEEQSSESSLNYSREQQDR